MKYVVFTDLDGTLIDHDTYSYKAARPALAALKKQGIPLIFCTSKTRAEIEV
ncbi:MAG: HAD hydrolase family protein, partial [Methanosarcinaceae archaeon]|nr:HAD hydrolase family protein [Methanosarcinaceae archaeon]